jgi:Na+-transporting NADH:ubiquinone oxidoreductase subunit NqrC
MCVLRLGAADRTVSAVLIFVLALACSVLLATIISVLSFDASDTAIHEQSKNQIHSQKEYRTHKNQEILLQMREIKMANIRRRYHSIEVQHFIDVQHSTETIESKVSAKSNVSQTNEGLDRDSDSVQPEDSKNRVIYGW